MTFRAFQTPGKGRMHQVPHLHAYRFPLANLKSFKILIPKNMYLDVPILFLFTNAKKLFLDRKKILQANRASKF